MQLKAFLPLIPVFVLALPEAVGAREPVLPPTPEGYVFREEVYLTLEEALEQVFGKGATVLRDEFVLSEDQKKTLERSLGRRLSEEGFLVHRGFRDGEFLGDAVVTEEIGLFKFITFLVHVDPEGKVGQAAVLTYREPRGMEVRRRRFLKQYEGKTVEDPISLNRDIVNIAGATLSARALSAGVKKVLHFIVEVYRPAVDRAADSERKRGGGKSPEP